MPRKGFKSPTAPKNEAEIRARISLLSAVLDDTPEGIFATDENNRVVVYNRDVEQVEQMSRGEVLGRTEKDVYAYDPGYTFNEQVIEKVKKTGKSIHNQRYAQGLASGKTVHLFLDAYPFNWAGKLAGVFTIGQRLDRLNDLIARTVPFKRQVISESCRAPSPTRFHFEDIIGSDPQFKNCLSMAAKVAKYNSSVMIIGETGTGKELLAQAIHNASPGASGPFVDVNCAAIPDNLMEGLLFGSMTGAFTEAIDMPGLFEQAEGGTVFFDEINSLAPNLQAKLLRAIQDRRVRRLGGSRDISINCRLISATNMDPFQAEDSLVIRADLLFRLAAVSLHIPPLRDRRGDIILLSRHLIRRFNKKYGLLVSGLSRELERMFLEYDWPGNVRELNNLIESSMCLLEPGERLALETTHLPDYFLRNLGGARGQRTWVKSGQVDLAGQMRELEKRLISEALAKAQGNVTRAASLLKIGRSYLHVKMKALDLKRPDTDHLPGTADGD